MITQLIYMLICMANTRFWILKVCDPIDILDPPLHSIKLGVFWYQAHIFLLIPVKFQAWIMVPLDDMDE